jgi:hypothetical protein
MQKNPPKSESDAIREWAGESNDWQAQSQRPTEHSHHDDISSVVDAARQIGRPPLNHRR